MAALLLILCLALAACGGGQPAEVAVRLERQRIPADGFSSVAVDAYPQGAAVRVLEGERFARIEGSRVFSTVLPGRAIIEARMPSGRAAKAVLETTPVWSDRFDDGTPDFLRLDDPGDVIAFRERFIALAEAQYFSRNLPAEITDCSSLIRYAYRETFRGADGPAKYKFPFTPVGARIFIVGKGEFAEFADAESLRRWNTHFISRDLRQAQRGDLLFYRQLDQRSPWHVMIFAGEHVVYHTGPVGKDKGEIRRPTVDELLRHPLPKWRPLQGNSNFLGIYRWNILKQDS